MTFNIEGQLLETILETLQSATDELTKCMNREKEMQAVLESNKLMTEVEAMAYLGRDANTLLYYRKNGLNYYKCGRDVWYRKRDIDSWLEVGRVSRRNR